MKILQINTFVNSGSTGRIAEEIGVSILKEKGESYIAYGRNERPSQSKLIKIGGKKDVLVNGMLSRLLDNHGFGLKTSTQELIEQIEKINPDIIHLHNIHGYYLNVEVLFKFLKKINKPVVWTLHDCWSYTGHCAYYTFVDCKKWTSGCGSCPQIDAYPSSFFIDKSSQNYRKKRELFTSLDNLTIITVSNWLQKEVEKSYLKNKIIKTINNGVNLDVFKSSEENVFIQKYGLKDKFIILGVANVWEKRKGLEYFIELSNKLNKDEIIFLVGLTEKQINSLPQNIIGITRTESTHELSLLYSGAHVYFNPTLEDNFPTTNLESLACDTPVITFNTGGSPESVTEKVGFVVPKGDLKEVIKSINYLKNNNYKNNCRNRAIEYYNKDDRFNDYIKLYKEIIKN